MQLTNKNGLCPSFASFSTLSSEAGFLSFRQRGAAHGKKNGEETEIRSHCYQDRMKYILDPLLLLPMYIKNKQTNKQTLFNEGDT